MDFISLKDLTKKTPLQEELFSFLIAHRRCAMSTITTEFERLCKKYGEKYHEKRNRSKNKPGITYSCDCCSGGFVFKFTTSGSNPTPTLTDILSIEFPEEHGNNIYDMFSQTNSIYNGEISLTKSNITSQNVKRMIQKIVEEDNDSVDAFDVLRAVKKSNPNVELIIDEKMDI